MKNYRILLLLIMVCLFKVNLLSAQTLTDGLISVWELDNMDGAVATDAYGSNDGTVSGATVGTGVLDNAMVFQPYSANKVEFPAEFLTGLSQFTISAWINLDNATGINGIFTSWLAENRSVLLRGNNGQLQFYILTGGPGGVGGSFTSIENDVWIHIVAIYDGSLLKVYKDGAIVPQTYSTSGTTNQIGDHQLAKVGHIGNYINYNNTILSWNGAIDQVAFWDRELTVDEVAQLYNSGSGLASDQWNPAGPGDGGNDPGTGGLWSANGSSIYYNTGDVGIGTSETFGYQLAVNGSIGAVNVKVENTSAWPDFVFKPEYDLKSLEEVEAHIVEKGHLPEVPSESEINEEGIDLGEMDAKLLQKIEELTLYIIDQNKRLKKLEEKNIELQQEISSLKNE